MHTASVSSPPRQHAPWNKDALGLSMAVVGTMFSAAKTAARSAIRDGAINRIARSAHPGQQLTDLSRCDPDAELLRQASSQFIIRQILAEEPHDIVGVASIEIKVVNPAAWADNTAIASTWVVGQGDTSLTT